MTDSKLPSISIIIPNYNGEKLIPLFMPSVLSSAKNYGGDWEIVVVDDKSTDNSLEEIKKFPELRLVEREQNGGFPAACNSGMRAARNDILFYLNTDVELEDDFFHHFAEHFDKEDTFAVTVKGIQYRTKERLDGGKIGIWKRGNIRVTDNYYTEDHPDLKVPYPSFGFQGAYFFADAGKIHELGGMDEIFSPFIFEETDLGYRAMKRGWKIYYEPRCVAHHDHSTTIKSVASKRRLQMISTRNRLLFTWKNIHSPRMYSSHWLFSIGKLLSLNPTYWSAFLQARKLWPQIAEQREIEKKAARISDEELFRNFQDKLTVKI